MQCTVHLTHEMRAAENVSTLWQSWRSRPTSWHFRIFRYPCVVINYWFIAMKIDSHTLEQNFTLACMMIHRNVNYISWRRKLRMKKNTFARYFLKYFQQKTNFSSYTFKWSTYVFMYFIIIVADCANCIRYDFMRIIKKLKDMPYDWCSPICRDRAFTVYYHGYHSPYSLVSHIPQVTRSRPLTVS